MSCLAVLRAAEAPPLLPIEAGVAVPIARSGNIELQESPVLFFRRLLPLPEAEREKQLAAKPEWQRKVLRDKLEEYALLPAEEREARLQVLQLRFYLLPLMKLPPAARSNHLARIPGEWRFIVDERLTEWDLLPISLQREVLESETTRYYFVRLERGTQVERKAILARFPPQKRQEMERGLQQWLSVPAGQRSKFFARLDRFLEMTPGEKERILGVFSDEERLQMQKTLEAFQSLSKDQREHCQIAFQKFSAMSAAERELFFANVERWREMSAEERQTWRDLVSALPPMPPGFVAQSLPPLPPQ